ncbi:MAG: AI-2E family transporter [Patescibacteria group bacterium]|nr:AI-2E family transporter [Patescibacteria group bacterium]
MDEEKVLDISWSTILRISVTLLVFYTLYSIKDILVSIIFALVISILFNPAINFLERKRIPRVIGTIFMYVSIFALLSLILYWIVPIFIYEIQQFGKLFPQYFGKLSPPLRSLGLEAFDSFETFTLALQEWLIEASSSIFGVIISIFGGIFSTVSIFAIAIFFSMEEKEVQNAVKSLAPKKNEEYFLNLWQRGQTKTAAWFGTRVLSSIFVGLVSYLALSVLDVNYASVLSLFAGVMDIIPVLGPIFAGTIITLLAALDSWLKAFFVLVAFILIQLIEGNIITPILTKKLVGLPAVLVLISVLVGGRLAGGLGAILAIPLTSIIYEFLRDYLKKRKENSLVT